MIDGRFDVPPAAWLSQVVDRMCLMASATTFRCRSCGEAVPKWVGRCPSCERWNTVEEASPTTASVARVAATPITDVSPTGSVGRPTGLGEFDRVLGGGLLPGSVTLFGGEPGVGKSTLIVQVAAAVAATGRRVLYVSAEESAVQVRQRAERVGALVDSLWLAAEHDVEALIAQADVVQPDLLVIDSVQTVFSADVTSSPGSVAQVRAVADRLVRHARRDGPAVLLVGQVTKDGSLAGPRTLEHQVDTVLHFEGERHNSLRLLRAAKHRFGSTGELGVFEMTGSGLVEVPDPSALFLQDRRPGAAGSAVVPVIDGGRPLLVEVQALLVGGALGSPRRTAQGVDAGRLHVLLAVLDRCAGLPLSDTEVYVSAVGGVRITEPGVDLALLLALASAARGVALPPDLVVCGEVGLAGEVRRLGQLERRLAEAARLGFRWAAVPRAVSIAPPGLQLLPVADVAEALTVSGLHTEQRVAVGSTR